MATEEYDADGPYELSLSPNQRVIIVGLLVSCCDWFVGRKDSTGEVGLVKTSMVEPEDIQKCVHELCFIFTYLFKFMSHYCLC